MIKLSLKNIGLVIIFTLITIVVVKAGTDFNVSVKDIDTSAFPQVRLSITISGNNDKLYARHFSVNESGERNMGATLLLPPSSEKSAIDLKILLDKSGNTKQYESIIKGNLKNLIHYLEDQSLSVNITLHSFGDDSSQDVNLSNVTDAMIDDLTFGSNKIDSAYGFAKISELASSSSSGSPEKIVLIINGTQFYNDEYNQNFKNAVKSLYDNGYTAFVIGYPLQQLYPLKPNNIAMEDHSIFTDSYGGYLGAFGTDLTVIHDLFQKSYEGNYVFQYYSNQSPSNASYAQIYIDDNQIDNINYPGISSASPSSTVNTEDEVILGDDLPISIEISQHGKLVNVVEMGFLNGEGGVQTQILKHNRAESTDDKLVYSGLIKEVSIKTEDGVDGDYTGQFVKFWTTIHTPYDTVSTEGSPTDIPIFAYDDGINLHYQLHPDNKIKWYWDGPSVDEGKVFQLWGGGELLGETNEKHLIVSYDKCSSYQVVKLRVSKVTNPTEEDWGLYSKPGEVFLGEEGSINEKEGIEIMIECLDNDKREATSISSFVQDEPEYNASSNLDLDRMLYYFTGVISSEYKYETEKKTGRFGLLYYVMNFINKEQYDEYDSLSAVSRLMLFKVITNINQVSDLDKRFEIGLYELYIRIHGTGGL